MYKRILLAYDGSDAGQKALLDCKDLAQWSAAALHLIAVMPPALAFVGLEGGAYDAELEARERTRHEAVLEDGLRRLADAGQRQGGTTRRFSPTTLHCSSHATQMRLSRRQVIVSTSVVTGRTNNEVAARARSDLLLTRRRRSGPLMRKWPPTSRCSSRTTQGSRRCRSRVDRHDCAHLPDSAT